MRPTPGDRATPLPRVRLKPGSLASVRDLVASHGLRTVCEGALCPNRPECYASGQVTVLILGSACTRSCSFCSVGSRAPAPPDPEEPGRVADLVARLGMRHVVVTSVTRDDLPDGGASQFRAVAEALAALPDAPSSEALIPDFGGDAGAVGAVAAAPYGVLSHNMETVPRLYPAVRPQAEYRRSLGVLAALGRAAPGKMVKSGLMLGLGETREEVTLVLQDLRAAGVEALCVGQYLRPTARQLPAARLVPEEEFQSLAEEARALGFRSALCGPLVRSSYRAQEAALLFDRPSVPLLS